MLSKYLFFLFNIYKNNYQKALSIFKNEGMERVRLLQIHKKTKSSCLRPRLIVFIFQPTHT